MSKRVPILRGNTRDTGFIYRGAEWGDQPTEDFSSSFHPVSFTEAELIEFLRVRTWNVELTLELTYLNTPDPGSTTNNATISGGLLKTFADTGDNVNLDLSGNLVVSRLADNEGEALSRWHAGTQDLDSPTQNTYFQPYSYLYVHGNVSFGGGTSIIHHIDPTWQGSWSGDWSGSTFGGGREFTFEVHSGGLWNYPQYPLESTGANGQVLYDPTTRLWYPMMYCVAGANISSFGSSAQTIKFNLTDLPAGSFNMMGKVVPLWWNPAGSTLTFTDMQVSGDVTPLEYWAFKNKAGLPVYDTTTGAQINDPFA